MNCYNSAKYLREAIDSVLAQTYEDWEIIFWDNQSEDESAAIVKSYSDKRIRYFTAPKHTVLGEARNMAIAQSQSQWIAFLDCDDLWTPEKLEKQISLVKTGDTSIGLVYGRMNILTGPGSNKSNWGTQMVAHSERDAPDILSEGKIFDVLLKKNIIPLVSAMVRRTSFYEVGQIDPALRQSEDYDLFVKIANKYSVLAVQETVAYYRIHHNNISNYQDNLGFLESIKVTSKYLPRKEAKVGIRHHQSYFAIYELRSGRVFWGLWRLVVYGDLVMILLKVGKLIFRRKTLFALRKKN